MTNSPGRCYSRRAWKGEVSRSSVQMAKLEKRKSGQGETRDKGAPGALRKESGGDGTGIGTFSFWQEEPPKGFTQELAGTGLPSRSSLVAVQRVDQGKGATEPSGGSYNHG